MTAFAENVPDFLNQGVIVPYFGTMKPYLCLRILNQTRRYNMWLAVIIGVCLLVEVLSHLSGEEVQDPDIKDTAV